MNILKQIQEAIKTKNDSAVDTLLYISKFESFKLTKDNHDDIFGTAVKMVKEYYQTNYGTSYSKEAESLYRYIGVNPDNGFYSLDEIDLNNHELVTDKIVRRMRQIKKSSCSMSYKSYALKILNQYLKELAPLEKNKEACSIIRTLFIQKWLMRGILLLFISYAFWLPKVVRFLFNKYQGIPKELIYDTMITDAVGVLLVVTLLFYFLFKTPAYRKNIIHALIFSLLFVTATFPDYIKDIRTDITDYQEETVSFYSITQNPWHKEIKTAVVQRDDGSKDTYVFHTDLELEYGKTYIIKFNETNIIVDAIEQ